MNAGVTQFQVETLLSLKHHPFLHILNEVAAEVDALVLIFQNPRFGQVSFWLAKWQMSLYSKSEGVRKPVSLMSDTGNMLDTAINRLQQGN